MRKLAALSVVILGVGVPFSVASAAEEGATPTTVVTEQTTVERDVTLTTTETRELEDTDRDNDTDDGDESDKTGLWGLLGLLGLAGLAGLKRRRDDDTYTRGRVSGDTTPRGSTATRTD